MGIRTEKKKNLKKILLKLLVLHENEKAQISQRRVICQGMLANCMER